MNVLGTLRQTYLYTALTIAGGAIVLALVSFLGLGLELAGLATRPPMPEQVREAVSGGIATLLFAVPIGAVHLWLVGRALADPSERACAPRHLFLNAWIVVGLFMVVVQVANVAEITLVQNTKDVAFPIASIVAGIAIALVGWRWRDAYPEARRDARSIAAFATLGLATVAIVMEVVTLTSAVLNAVLGETYYGYLYLPPGAIWSALIGVAAGLAMWWIGLRWQWPWRDLPFRTIYAAAGYGLGLALVAIPGSDLLARLIGIAVRGLDPAQLRGVLEAPAVGVVLVAMHLPWLVTDRGRIGYPARVTDRIVRGIAAVCGLAAVTLAATAWGSVIVQDWLRIGPPQDDPLKVRDQAVATLLLALALYPLPWWGFLHATAGDPRSSLRRAYVLFVACASLLGAIVAGVVSVTNLIQMAMGATLSGSAIRNTIDAAGWLAIFAVVLAAHIWLLLGDMRAARALGPTAISRPAAVDPIDAILEDVAAGRMGTREASIKIRALTTSPRAAGRTTIRPLRT